MTKNSVRITFACTVIGDNLGRPDRHPIVWKTVMQSDPGKLLGASPPPAGYIYYVSSQLFAEGQIKILYQGDAQGEVDQCLDTDAPPLGLQKAVVDL